MVERLSLNLHFVKFLMLHNIFILCNLVLDTYCACRFFAINSRLVGFPKNKSTFIKKSMLLFSVTWIKNSNIYNSNIFNIIKCLDNLFDDVLFRKLDNRYFDRIFTVERGSLTRLIYYSFCLIIWRELVASVDPTFQQFFWLKFFFFSS